MQVRYWGLFMLFVMTAGMFILVFRRCWNPGTGGPGQEATLVVSSTFIYRCIGNPSYRCRKWAGADQPVQQRTAQVRFLYDTWYVHKGRRCARPEILVCAGAQLTKNAKQPLQLAVACSH
jgi:hypothetical protein